MELGKQTLHASLGLTDKLCIDICPFFSLFKKLTIKTMLLCFITQALGLVPFSLAQAAELRDATVAASGTSRSTKKRVKKEEKVGPTSTKIVKDEVRTEEGHQAGTGIAIFMGVTGGQLTLSTDDPKLESNKSGFYIAGKALTSFYSENWVTDVGLGWYFGEVSSPGPGTGEIPLPQEGIEYTPGPVRIALNAGLFEVAPRFRITENWQIGPVADIFFSTDDTSFNGLIADADSPSRLAALLGAQIMYGVPKKQADWRAGLEYLTDVSIGGRQLHIISFTLQFGLPLVSPDTIYQDREILTERQRTEMVEKQRLERKVVVKEVVKFVFERQQILFLNNSEVLHIDSQSFLLELANNLKENNGLFEEITIEAHAGPGQPPSTAKKLSQRRATNVRSALISAGMDQSKIKAVGFGAEKPIRPSFPSERDERIVLSFSGIKNIRRLAAAVNGMRKQFHIPETCLENEGCR